MTKHRLVHQDDGVVAWCTNQLRCRQCKVPAASFEATSSHIGQISDRQTWIENHEGGQHLQASPLSLKRPGGGSA